MKANVTEAARIGSASEAASVSDSVPRFERIPRVTFVALALSTLTSVNAPWSSKSFK